MAVCNGLYILVSIRGKGLMAKPDYTVVAITQTMETCKHFLHS